MSLLARVKSIIFGQKEEVVLATYDAPALAVPENVTEPLTVAYPIEGASNPLKTVEIPLVESVNEFEWIENDELLRDEGVIFGLSNADADEKIGMIRNYFSQKTAITESEIEQLNEKIQELNLFIEQRETRIDEFKTKIKTIETPPSDEPHELPRTLVGLVCSVAMCVGNYFLIADSVRPLYPNSNWVAVGVFLAGMFNLFGRVSLFHETSKNVTWRNFLEEIGMPLAAALFVAVQALQTQSLGRTLALFVFVLFLFLFAGKLMLSTLTVLRKDLGIWLNKKQWKAQKTTNTQQWEDNIDALETQIDELRVQKWQLIPTLNRAEANRTRMNAQRDMLIKIFESEFRLARQLKERLNEQQLRELRNRLG